MSLKVGQTFNYTFLLTKKVSDLFINISNDKNPIHLDSEYAKKFGFESNIAHGNILNCFLSYFVGERLPFKDVVILSQSIKFIKPLHVGDSVFFEAQVISISESVFVFEIDFSFKKKNEIHSKGSIKIKKLT